VIDFKKDGIPLTALVFVVTVSMAVTATPTRAEDQPAIPQAEVSDTASLAFGPHYVIVYDWVEAHAKDGKAFIVDGDDASLKATLSAAFYANVVTDPLGKSFYVAETIWSRGNRGDRQDLLTVYDAKTTQISKEIKLPGRALITTKKQDADVSADGKLVYVFNMDPSDSVIVVDPAAGKVVGSVDIPGCALVYPFGNTGFSSICADGVLATVGLADPAKPTLVRSKPFFDPDKDPVFEHSPTDRATGMTYFITYQGIVHPTRLGPTPVFDATWSLEAAAGVPAAAPTPPAEEQWRPGGWQMSAFHKATSHLFVLMHKGPYWTHKADGTEVWEFDAQTHKLIKKIALKEPSPMVDVSQDDKPLLYTTTDAGKFSVYDVATGQHLRDIDKLGDNPVLGYVAGQ
jgi:methylamine dehydrogenase heavy chain